jgi:GT2 family glycosyltransferase
MVPNFINNLTFDNVSFRPSFRHNFLESSNLILFKLNNKVYELTIDKGENGWFATGINHGISDVTCKFCGFQMSYMDCPGLEKYIDEIFEVLKEHPSVRLHLLY